MLPSSMSLSLPGPGPVTTASLPSEVSSSWTPSRDGAWHRAGPAGRNAAVAVLAGAVASFIVGRQRSRGVARQASETFETREAREQRAQNMRETIDASTPVPKDFNQAVSWACGAALKATQAGRFRQSMYFNSGAGTDARGELGIILAFAAQFAETISGAKALLERPGNGVRLVFSDLGAYSVAQGTVDQDANVTLDYFPSAGGVEAQDKMAEMCNSSLIIVVAPQQTEADAITVLLQALQNAKYQIPVILLNPKLVRDKTTTSEIRQLISSLLPCFYMEQLEAPKNTDLNPSVLARVWPRPFSLWEDNPDDPESIDGYFLLDVNDVKPQSKEEILQLLKTSRDLLQKLKSPGVKTI